VTRKARRGNVPGPPVSPPGHPSVPPVSLARRFLARCTGSGVLSTLGFVVACLALGTSYVSYDKSVGNERHARLVNFEQRKQELLLQLLDSEAMAALSEAELGRALQEHKDFRRAGVWAKMHADLKKARESIAVVKAELLALEPKDTTAARSYLEQRVAPTGHIKTLVQTVRDEIRREVARAESAAQR
jgi:hypothetical protein